MKQTTKSKTASEIIKEMVNNAKDEDLMFRQVEELGKVIVRGTYK